jgi:parallel beta-helix repeat protein
MRQQPLRYKLRVFLTLVIGILMFQSIFFPSGFLIKENYIQGEKEGLEASDYWILPYTIHIDGNWSATESTYDWCTGAGTYDHPYLIENVMIDAQNSGSCIFIENTDEYFVIHNCTVINGQATGGQAGIKMSDVSNGTILHNLVTENYAGMYLDSIENITIIDNYVIDNNGQGIILAHSNKNYILDNYQTGSRYYGLLLNALSANNTVTGNTFQNNTGAATYGIGIRILNSQGNFIIDNILINNDKGIQVEDNSNSNTITENIITDNSVYGALVIANTRASTNNLFYLNTFENPAYNAYDNGTDSFWDNGTIGNYWSDYSGVDANDDGIGDTPYLIEGAGGGMDNYPIYDDGPFYPPGMVIYIDDADPNYDWSKTAAENYWCTGTGTWNDPYVIRDLEIDGQSDNSGIVVLNSSVYFRIENCSIHNIKGNGIDLVNANNSVIYNNSIYDVTSGIGVYLEHSYNTNVSHNNLWSINDLYVSFAVNVINSENCKILNNTITNSHFGIMVMYSSVVTVLENDVYNNDMGLGASFTVDVSFKQNKVINSTLDGITIQATNTTIIEKNLVLNSDGSGIVINIDSFENSIIENQVYYNDGVGLAISESSYENEVYLNEFIGNNINAQDNGTLNKWDNGAIGNYWDDYVGVDANDDGIGDTPYFIGGTAGSLDNCPIYDDGLEDSTPPPTVPFGSFYLFLGIISMVAILTLIRFKRKLKYNS